MGSQFCSKGPMDPIDRLAEWYNYERSHAARRGRDAGRGARPQDAPKGVTVLDEQPGIAYRHEYEECTTFGILH